MKACGHVGLLGFPCDIGVRRNAGRGGAQHGPVAFRKALARMPGAGAGSPERAFMDFGDVAVEGDALESAQAALARAVTSGLDQVDRLLVIGGGHETAYGSHSGLRRQIGDQVIGVISLDAHFDLRDPVATGATSGTPFSQIHSDSAPGTWRYLVLGLAEEWNSEALFTRARELGTDWVTDRALQFGLDVNTRRRIDQLTAASDVLHLSIDLDVLPHYQAPGVSAPAVRGVPMHTLEAILDYILASAQQCPGGLRLVDLVELNPQYDQQEMTARSAAVLANRVLGLRAQPNNKQLPS